GSGDAGGALAQDLEDGRTVARPRALPERARDRRLELRAWRDEPRAGQGLARRARDGGAERGVAAGEVVADQAEVEGAEHEGEECEGGDGPERGAPCASADIEGDPLATGGREPHRHGARLDVGG